MPNIRGRWAGSINELILVILGAVTTALGYFKSWDTWVTALCLGVRLWAQLAALRGKPKPRVALSRGQGSLGLLGGEAVDSKRCGDLGYKYPSSSTARSKMKSRSTTPGDRSLY